MTNTHCHTNENMLYSSHGAIVLQGWLDLHSIQNGGGAHEEQVQF